MNGKDIAKMAIEQKRPPRLPVALIAGGEWYAQTAGLTFPQIINNPELIAKIYINGFQKVGQDMLWTGAGLLNYPVHFLGCPIVEDSFSTPALKGTVISSLDDLPGLQMEKVTQNPTMQGIIQAHHLVADAIGTSTLIMPTLWGPFTTASRILGVEPLMMATVMDPDRLADLIAFSTELIWSLAEQMLDHPEISGLNISEPVASGDLISPANFQGFVKPYLKEITIRTKKLNKLSSLHICGNTTRILEDVLDIRPDCYSLEAKVNLQDARKVLGGKVCVLGNLSPTGSFYSGKADDVLQEAGECTKTWGDPVGFILANGCDFPKEVPLENIKAFMSFQERML
jgi:uroporphyrinogen decarboxylase